MAVTLLFKRFPNGGVEEETADCKQQGPRLLNLPALLVPSKIKKYDVVFDLK